MIQVAIYGKGGIGKSTTSANISYLLAKKGLKVAQVGCDPKHDSTRLLLNGKTQKTVLDHINSKSEDISQTVCKGKNGITCIETGGPEPGVGCAGRGILTAFSFLENNEVLDKDTDIILYDVLGDVVCGGFAIPLRRKYANVIFIVTSGEFMSLYAANNVLKGIRNFDGTKARVGGLILNCRGNEGEYEYVKNFADAVNLPIVAVIPRTLDFSKAESAGTTVTDMFPESEETTQITKIADIIEDLYNKSGKLYPALPLNDDDLDLIAKGKKVARDISHLLVNNRCLATSEHEALRSCGSAVVAHICSNILDSDVIIHGPKSCHYFFTCSYDVVNIFRDKCETQKKVSDRIFCTDLTDSSSIFGGKAELSNLIEERYNAGTRTIFVVTTCVPGIIGDDVEGICEEAHTKHPDASIIPISIDGILNGGSIQGREYAVAGVCKLVDKEVQPEKCCVNLIGYNETADRIMQAADDTHDILKGLGMAVNCEFLNDNYVEEVVNLRKGKLNVKCGYTVGIRKTAVIVKDLCGIPYMEKQMPVGIGELKTWVAEFGELMSVPESKQNEVIQKYQNIFDEFVKEYEGTGEDKTAVIYCPTTNDMEWLYEILDVLKVKILRIICPINSKWNFADEKIIGPNSVPIEYDVNFDGLKQRLEELKPDIVLGSNLLFSQLKQPHMAISRPRNGIRSQLEYAKRLIRLLEVTNL